MPPVEVTNTKGLVQKTGASVDIQNTLSFSGDGGIILPTSSPTGTTTVLADTDSGKVIFMDASSANTITLPVMSTISAGWNVKVVLTATGAAGVVQTGNTLEDLLAGNITAFDADGDAVAVTSDTTSNTVTFVNGCLAGAWVHIYSNGTLFYVDGFGTHASASNKITLTDE